MSTESVFSYTIVQQQQLAQRQTIQQQLLSTIVAQSTILEQDLERQRAALAFTRYVPYQPHEPACPPPSVVELEMRTRNVGVPIPTMTIARCKGSQFVTK